MSLSYCLSAPYNNLSLGSVSVALTRELFKRGETPSVFPMFAQAPDLSAQVPDQGFNQKLEASIVSAHQRYNRKMPCFRNWHIQSSLESHCEKGNHLLTWMELDQLTPTEVNVLRQQVKVYVTSRFTQGVMSQYGIQAAYLPIGFDSHNFRPLAARPGRIDGVTQFLLAGKLEHRKGHLQVLRAWARRYGGNPAYRLNCSVFNHFLPPDRANAMIGEALEGKAYWNIIFHPFHPDNATYNSLLQSSEIVIAMSGGEGRDLPCYHATALGAWPVAMRAHAYLDYLNDENAVLISPNGKRPAADGVHFSQGGPFNQGNLFTFDDEAFLKGCEEAEHRARVGLNLKGMDLQKVGYEQAVDILLADLSVAQ